MADKVRFFDGKKFMWDSEDYADKEKAEEAKKKYSDDGFEVQSCEEDGKVLLYTRRVVTEIVLE
ncbi:MAG: hypothetical protein JSW59_13990 [Phycisphaerales bacterium]|nr:MAG: hypothetical protein JSW59_13990 [Phycisphaerales bacterium]